MEDKMIVVNKCIAHPWQCDVMCHLTTRFYVGMFDDAAYHFLYEVFGWTINTEGKSKIGWADVRHVIEYKAEVSAGDVLEIKAYLVKIGTKSFTALYEMVNIAKNEIAATLESTCVLFDLDARIAIPLNDEMTSKAKNYLET
jgi:acyl-CoA thioester hydrolase